jgi:SAM-dependent methyltransferase
MYPIRLGTEPEFTALRKSLLACDYTEAAICQRFEVPRVSALRAGTTGEPTDPLRLLVRLFIEGGAVPPAAASQLPVAELDALGFINASQDRIVANAMLYPTRGLYIASDRSHPIEKDSPPPDDIVYPAIVPNTELFLDYIPRTPCDALLDLCAGTGIAALVAAKSGARHAWAFDLTPRSTHFAEFNRRLNAVTNMTPAEGDLYQPAGDLTFDRIVSHPPYLPVYRPHFVFDSGGQDGEQVVKRMVEDLPRYLRPGGRFYALTMGSDREHPFEMRLRQWLGQSQGDFDVTFLVRRAISPREYSADTVVLHKGSAEDIAGWRELFMQWGVRSMAYGIVVIQRRATDRPVFTVRRDAGENTGPAELEWLVDWATAGLDASKVLTLKPRTRENISLRIDHLFTQNDWHPASYRVASDYPFNEDMRAEPWTAHMLRIADGSLSIQELLDHLKFAEALPESVDPTEFARAVATMISTGLLELDDFKLPASTSPL